LLGSGLPIRARRLAVFKRLTYFHGGLDQKLVGVEGAEPIREVLA
jgi:hypothetical protein